MAEDSARQRFANYMRLPETAEEECEGRKHKQILKDNTTSTRRLNDTNIYIYMILMKIKNQKDMHMKQNNVNILVQ